jgi:surface antigen
MIGCPRAAAPGTPGTANLRDSEHPAKAKSEFCPNLGDKGSLTSATSPAGVPAGSTWSGWGIVMHIASLGIAALVAVSVAACAATPETGQGAKENTGTFVGALAGGLIGSQFGGGTGEHIAAGLAGAAIGGMIGNRIGASMDDEDKKLAYAAQVQALESGPSGGAVPWRNPDSGRYGSVVPGRAYQANGLQCRPYTHTIYINGTPQVARGNACRNPDGTWTVVS